MHAHHPTARRLARLIAANQRLRSFDTEPRNRSPWLPALQRWQAQRLKASFAAFLKRPDRRAAAEFFLSDLYGDQDVSGRDSAVARIVPRLIRLLPDDFLRTAADAIELGALSHAFDLRMVDCLVRGYGERPRVFDEALYAQVYRDCGLPRLRARQIDLIVEVGQSLDEAVRHPMLGRVLKLSRLPARAAGLWELQQFLERGFAAFAKLGGADEFLATIERQEREASRRLFAGHPQPFAPPS
ncbi:MAG: hypothetical protein H4O13_03980 [Xanthomonadales bacterium]|nr:hypothetical protein [Xanthomonadales bacterium]